MEILLIAGLMVGMVVLVTLVEIIAVFLDSR